MDTIDHKLDSRPGMLTKAKRNFRDLFRMKQRVTLIDENGGESIEYQALEWPTNPITLLGAVSARGWLFFTVAFFAWVCDALDFHALSIAMTKVSAYYDVSKTEVSTAITLTLLLRSVGAAIFGVASDFYGRKWPMVINMWLLGALQVGTIYAPDFKTFLAVRSLFGIGMGGVWGNAVSMGLEAVPVESRGILSGIMQQGYSFGYVLAACLNLRWGGEPEGFKKMFWVGAAASFFVGCVRCFFPDSKQFVEARKAGKRGEATTKFFAQAKSCCRQEWRNIIYCCVLMALFNFYSHSSQDTYTTFLLETKGFTNSQASRSSILMKTGACVGGTIIGWLSQSFGRRRSIFVAAIISCLLIPAWILPNTEAGLSASGFMIQFFIQGAWGVIPVYLQEVSIEQYRASFPGITYQIGNAISSPSAQIITAVSESTFLTNFKGDRVEAFGPVMGVATVIIALSIAGWISIGEEKKGSHFELGAIAGMEKGVLPTTNNTNAYDTPTDGDDVEKHSIEKESMEKSAAPPVKTLTQDH